MVEEQDVYEVEIEQTRLESGADFKQEEQDDRISDLLNKSMHGEWLRNLFENGDKVSQKTFYWLKGFWEENSKLAKVLLPSQSTFKMRNDKPKTKVSP